MRVVLDTNIYLSGMLFPASKPAEILELAEKKAFETFCSDYIVEEFRRVFVVKFNYREQIADQFVQKILSFVKVIVSGQKIRKIKADDADNRILECAVSAKADYLVTGDKKHILSLEKIGQTKIISPAEFIEILKEK